MDADLVRGDHLDIVDPVDDDAKLHVAVGRRHVVQRIGHVLGVEVGAVMKLDAFAQLHLQRLVVRPLPFRRQKRQNFVGLRIAVDQAVALGIGRDQRLALIAVIDVRRVHLGGGGPHEGVVVLARQRGRRGERGETCRQEHCSRFHCIPLVSEDVSRDGCHGNSMREGVLPPRMTARTGGRP